MLVQPILVGEARLGIIFGNRLDARDALFIHRDREVHGPAADGAVFHVTLALHRAINHDLYGLAAVGALDLDGFRGAHGAILTDKG